MILQGEITFDNGGKKKERKMIFYVFCCGCYVRCICVPYYLLCAAVAM